LKNYFVAVILTGLMLALAFNHLAGSQTSPSAQYDPWADLNDDGKISMDEIVRMCELFGTTGDPTKNVNVTNWPYMQNVNVTNWPIDSSGYLKVTLPPIRHSCFGGHFIMDPGSSRIEAPYCVLPPGCKSVTIGLASHGTGSGDVYVLVGFAPFYEHWFPIYDGTVPTTAKPSTPVAYSIIKTCDVISDVISLRIYNPSAYTRDVTVDISFTF
jgi:hypothetical protein